MTIKYMVPDYIENRENDKGFGLGLLAVNVSHGIIA